MTTLTQKQIRSAIIHGAKDAREAVRESGSAESPDGGWDSWLINGAGESIIKSISKTDIDTQSRKLWLEIYHESACRAAAAMISDLDE